MRCILLLLAVLPETSSFCTFSAPAPPLSFPGAGRLLASKGGVRGVLSCADPRGYNGNAARGLQDGGGGNTGVSRRGLALMALSPLLLRPPPTWATGLAEKLKSRQSDALKKPLLPSIVVQPVKQVSYPEWLEGTWVAESRFAGYELPVKKLSKETLMKDTAIAGFQKLSVLTVPDMAASMRYPLRFVKNDNGKVVEDVAFNVASVVDNSLGYRAVQGVEYNPSKDAARVSVTFLPGKTRNAERIELFVNLAESQGSGGAFVTSQYFRQVTYSLSKEFGVARQEVGEYSHFWTYEQGDSPDQVRANLLTAAYLQPQDPLFFESPQMPVVVYSNEFRFKKLKPKA